ncbi:helix-turn-helix domain-containing protein [Myceligenerans halotolerans]
MTTWPTPPADTPTEACPITRAVDVVHSRWTTPILWALHTHGAQRFGELQRSLEISPKVLAAKLRQMERDGLITRRAYGEVPPRVEYDVTELGLTLQPVFVALSTWWSEHEPNVRAARESYAGPLPR